jgi:hypothetical protein
MKVGEVREVVCRLQEVHNRYGAKDMVHALRELARLLEPYDEQTVAAFAKRLKPRQQAGRTRRR